MAACLFQRARTVRISCAIFVLAGCSGSPSVRPEPPEPPEPPAPIAIPAQGTAATFDVATWNVRNFGAPNQAPSDDVLQVARVRDVIRGTDADLWGLQEMVSTSAFDSLMAGLPGYEGMLVNEARVEGGSDWYYPSELKVGLIWKSAVVTPASARVILSGLDAEFAGRPPLEVQARIALGGATVDAVVIVLHAKAASDTASWRKRAGAAAGLKEYLDTAWADAVVLAPGDWNDDLDTSITSGRDTPYRDFVDDSTDWFFPTHELTAAGLTSLLGYDDVIDHILASNEAAGWFQAGASMVYRVDEYIPNYRDTTSDHLPVLVRLRPAGGRPGRRGAARATTPRPAPP